MSQEELKHVLEGQPANESEKVQFMLAEQSAKDIVDFKAKGSMIQEYNEIQQIVSGKLKELYLQLNQLHQQILKKKQV